MYDPDFYASIAEAAASSARVIVPLVLDLVAPASVLDVGCGDGTWLAAYLAAGVADAFGVDRTEAAAVLKTTADRFAPVDLSAPLDLGRRFDLAQSLEVAEHLPEAAAGSFVRSLCRHADVVLFSAAVPHQGGTGHLNEQWPDYWAELFIRAGYVAIDCVRPRVWDDQRVAWWYAQNALVFARVAALRRHPRLHAEWRAAGPCPLRLVHPGNYARLVGPAPGASPPG